MLETGDEQCKTEGNRIVKTSTGREEPREGRVNKVGTWTGVREALCKYALRESSSWFRAFL